MAMSPCVSYPKHSVSVICNKQSSFLLSPKPQQQQNQPHQINTRTLPQFRSSFVGFNPLRVSSNCNETLMRTKKKQQQRGSGGPAVVCYYSSSSLLSPLNLQWISTVSTAVLMVARGTAIQKSFLVPLFALQAHPAILSWIKSEYGMWTASLAILVRLFYSFPGELELPFVSLLLAMVAPHQLVHLRGTQGGIIVSLLIAGYLAFQHFNRAGNLKNAIEAGSIVPTAAITSLLVTLCLLVART